MAKFYVTTPIYYVNDRPHIGHTYTTVLADVIARYRKLMGDDVFFLTGTDEHGQKVAQAAKKSGISPKEHCDMYSKRFKDLWKRLDIEFDHFIRTTDPQHEEVVKKALQYIYDKGDIYKDKYVGWYCVHDERFWTEKDLVGGKCPECGRDVVKIEEENYFFRMSKYQNWLIEYIESHKEFVQPDFRRNEVLGFLRKPLNDLCISRPKKRLSWGVELPFDTDYVTYVWVDALLNYVSAVGLYFDQAKFEKWWPADIHLIGKDILTTHAVYWPIILHALDLELPKTIFAHGWWLVSEQKMGKSLGNAVDPYALIEHIGVDQLRYYLMRDMVLGQDASYTLDGLVSRLNNDLSNDLGNILSRVTNMIVSYCDGKLPHSGSITLPQTNEFLEKISNLSDDVSQKITKLKIHAALESVNAAMRATNRYIEDTQPWKLAKSGEQEKLNEVLFQSTQVLAKAGILLYPVMPRKCRTLLDALGFDGEISISEAKKDVLIKPGTTITKPKALFPKIDLTKLSEALGVTEVPEKKEAKKEEQITINDFAKIELKVGKIVSARKAPNAEKLLLLDVDLGDEKRQLVAGIAKWYTPEELVGKNIVVLTNLKPAVIRGFESQGMLLAADDGENVVLITTDKPIAPGSKIR